MKTNKIKQNISCFSMASVVMAASVIFVINGCGTTGKQNKFGIDNHHETPEGLSSGQKAPDFSAFSVDKRRISLEEITAKSPVMLFFYRGYWCPVCNRYLENYQDSLQLITEKGVKVIGVAPETTHCCEEFIIAKTFLN